MLKEIKKWNNSELQYFSKLYKKWVDMKNTDSVQSLLKYGYKIRKKK